MIRNEGQITRADIISKSTLSAPTISRLLEILADKNLIKIDEFGPSIGGRRPQIIRFDAKNNYVIGIDIGGTFIRGALSNLDGEFTYEIHLPTEINYGFDGVMKQVGNLIAKLQKRGVSKNHSIFGIGIAVCGIVNKHTGTVDYSPIFGWKDVDLKKALAKYTDLHIAMGNVTHLIALGELLYGEGKKYSDFIAINLGYGIGSGIIINGQPFYGADGHSGEFGHIVIDKYSDKRGREKINGTIEALASGYGIAEIVIDCLKSGRSSELQQYELAQIDTEAIMNAAIAGDDLATEVIDAASEYIGIGIDTLLKLFNTQAIFLTGGLSFSGDFFTKKIEAKVRSLAMPFAKKEVPILLSSFGEDAALMGAFSLILEKILHLESVK